MLRSFTFYTDPGHGWLEIRLADLHKSGLRLADISRYSYWMQPADAGDPNLILYLEEDCDMPKFLKAWTAAGHQYGIVERYQHDTFIRALPSLHERRV